MARSSHLNKKALKAQALRGRLAAVLAARGAGPGTVRAALGFLPRVARGLMNAAFFLNLKIFGFCQGGFVNLGFLLPCRKKKVK